MTLNIDWNYIELFIFIVNFINKCDLVNMVQFSK